MDNFHLTEKWKYSIISFVPCKSEQAAIAQSVVRNIGSVEVTGSIPVSSFCKSFKDDFCL